MSNIKNKKTIIIIAIVAVIFAIIITGAVGSYFLYIIFLDNNSEVVTDSETNTYKTFDNNQISNEDNLDSSINNEEIIEDIHEPIPDINKEDIISKNNEVIRAAGVTNINQMDLYNIKQVETFSSGLAKFIIYPLKDISATEQEEGYFEAYQDTNLIYTSDKLYNITGIFSFDYNADTYIVVTSYSGGAHCCFTQYIFHQGEDDKVSLVRKLATNNSTISADNFFVENNKLYFSVMDDRFAYFYTSYASSYSFVRFFQLDQTNIADANNEFFDVFMKEARRCEAELDSINPSDIYSMEDWFPTLVCKSANYWYAGDQSMAWNNFSDYFDKFKASEDPNLIRQKMENILQTRY